MVGDFGEIFNYFVLCYNLINHAEETNPYNKKPRNASRGFNNNFDSEDEDYDLEQERRRNNQNKNSYHNKQ